MATAVDIKITLNNLPVEFHLLNRKGLLWKIISLAKVLSFSPGFLFLSVYPGQHKPPHQKDISNPRGQSKTRAVHLITAVLLYRFLILAQMHSPCIFTHAKCLIGDNTQDLRNGSSNSDSCRIWLLANPLHQSLCVSQKCYRVIPAMLRSKDDNFIKQNIKPLYRPRHTNVNGSICYKPVLASRKAVKRHLVWFS